MSTVDSEFEVRVGSYGSLLDDDLASVPRDRQHDIPPHCKPSEGGSQCCVGVLKGRCRKCGQIVWAASNIACSASPSPPWSAREWFGNWETHGR